MLRIVSVSVLLGLLAGGPVVAKQKLTVNAIKKIGVDESGETTVIRIEGATKPTFSVFRLQSPTRIFVDIVNADVSAVSDPVWVENGVIGQVGALQVATTGRIVITLSRSNLYQVKADGNVIRVIIDAAGRKKRVQPMEIATKKKVIKQLDAQIGEKKELLKKLRSAREKEELLKNQVAEARKREEQLRQRIQHKLQLVLKLQRDAELSRTHALVGTQKLTHQRENEEQRRQAILAARLKEQHRLEALQQQIKRVEAEQLALRDATLNERSKLETLRRKQQTAEKLTRTAVKERQLAEQRRLALAHKIALEEKKRRAIQRSRKYEEQLRKTVLASRLAMEKRVRLLKLSTRLALERQSALKSAQLRMERRKRLLTEAVAGKRTMLEKLRIARQRKETATVSALNQQLAELKQRVARQRELHTRKIASLKQTANEKAALLKLAQRQRVLQSKTLAQMQQERNDALKKAKSANSQLVKLDTEYKTALANLDALGKKKIVVTRKLAQRESESRLATMEQRLSTAKRLLSKMVAERKALVETVQQKHAQEKVLRRLLAQKTNAKTPSQKRALRQLNAKRAEILAAIAQLRETLNVEQTKYRQLVSQRTQEDGRIKELETKLGQFSALKKKVRLLGLKSQVEERRLTELRSKVETESRKAERISQQLGARQQSLQALKSAITQYRAKVETLKRLAQKHRRRSSKYASLTRRLQATETQLSAFRGAHALVKGRIKEQELKLERMKRSISSSETKLSALARQYVERVARIKGLDSKERRRLERLKGLDLKTTDRLARLRKLEHQRTKRVAELQQLREKRQELLVQLATLHAQKLATKKHRKSSTRKERAQIGSLQTKLNQKDEEIRTLLARLERLQNRDTPTSDTVDTKQKPNKIRQIRYSDGKGRSVVEIITGSPQKFQLIKGSVRHMLVLTDARIPRLLERSLDTSRRKNVLKLLSSYQDRKGHNVVKLVASIRSKRVGSEVVTTPTGLKWIFSQNTPKLTAKVELPQTDGLQIQLPGENTNSKVQTRLTTRIGALKLDKSIVKKEPGTIDLGTTKKKYYGRRINLTVKDADIQHVLTFLATVGRVNIIAGSGVRGTVTLHLEDVPWELAFVKILESKGLGYSREGNIITVRPLSEIAKEKDLAVKTLTKEKQLLPLKVRIVPVNYAKAQTMAGRIKSVLSKRGKVETDVRTNTLIITDIEDHINAASSLVKKLDLQTPQVLVEARIVEANVDFSRDIGIQWGGNILFSKLTGNPTGLNFPSTLGIAGVADGGQNATSGLFNTNPNFVVNMPAPVGAGSGGGLGFTFGSLGGTANLSLRLTAAESKGYLKIISSPRVTTLDQVPATISQGVSIPISVVSAAGVSTTFHSATLSLNVTPQVTQDGHVHLKIAVTKNEPDFGNTGARGDPTILTKSATTELLVKDGETSVIGGIYTRNVSRTSKKVPFFADIPILGWFFRQRSVSDKRTEMLIFITPRIVNRGKSMLLK